MNAAAPALAPPTTRLGQLQRGRGDGHLAAQAAAALAHDDLLQCLCTDPRADRQLEHRARYYGELLVAVELPLAPVLDALRDAGPGALGFDALAAAWALGHAPVRALLADAHTAEPIVAGITSGLWGEGWAHFVDLPPRARACWLKFELPDADSKSRERRPAEPTPLASLSVAEVLELARGPGPVRRDRLLGELCARGDDGTRAQLIDVVTGDRVFERVRLAARALGLLGDERLLPLAEDLFGREDVFEDPTRRLPAELRMRRACLTDYVRQLPAPLGRLLALAWHERPGYFATVAGTLFELHATAADRQRLEAAIAAQAAAGVFTSVAELDALGRLADPASVPLLVEVAEASTYSLARTRAVRALARLVAHPLAQAVVRQALWDAEDEASELACAAAGALDAAAKARVATLATSPLVAAELAARARERVARGP